MYVKMSNDATDEIARLHPKIFKLEENKSLSDYIDPDGVEVLYIW